MRVINAAVAILVIGFFAMAMGQVNPASKTVRFSGRITEWGGKPVANQTLHLKSDALEVTTETDGEGRFLFSALPVNQAYGLTVGESPVRVSGFTTGEKDLVLNIGTSLNRPIQISGRVIGADGVAIQNQTVTAVRSDGGSIGTQTDPDGKFSFQALSPNQRVSLHFDAAGFTPVTLDLTAKDRDLPLGAFVLQPMSDRPVAVVRAASGESVQPARISGRIIGAEGQPLARKTISLFNNGLIAKTHAWDLVQGTQITDQNGAFVFPAEGRSRYSIALTEPGNVSAQQALGDIEVADGIDVDLGSVAVQATPDTNRIGVLAGPVTVAPRPAAKDSPAAPLSKNTYIAGIFAGSGDAAVIQSDGRIIRVPEEKDQVSIGSPLIAEDRTAAGWLVETPFCCASYPIAMQLVLFRPGQPLLHLTGDGRGIFDWKFIGGGKQAAFYQSFPHGELRGHRELHDVQTGRLLGQWDDDSAGKAPAWTVGLQ